MSLQSFYALSTPARTRFYEVRPSTNDFGWYGHDQAGEATAALLDVMCNPSEVDLS